MRPSPTLFLLLCVLVAGAAPRAAAASDSGPQLIAKGPRWKNVEELKRYADQGDTLACLDYGGRLLSGEGVAADPAAARQYFARAAAAGSGDALFRLGKLWHDGIGGARDYGEAIKFYGEAAQAGVPEAMHNVGAMLVSARGVTRDYVEGLAWFIVAAKHGAVSDAEQRTRDRLAKRPRDIAAAEERAKEIVQALKQAKDDAARPRYAVRGESGPGAPVRSSPPLAPPKVETGGKVKVDVGPKLEAPKPPLDLPKS
jgi:TPR repeat protein